jgi:hypothetical protein
MAPVKANFGNRYGKVTKFDWLNNIKVVLDEDSGIVSIYSSLPGRVK